MISAPDRRLLLRLAREAIVEHLVRVPAPALEPCDLLATRAGAFVSIHRGGDLRGCIGHIEADETLAVLIPRCAVAAATQDPRFAAVSAAELDDLEIELSILGPLESIDHPDSFDIGRHGLVVQMGLRRGLLLPQVATEWNWDRHTFLAQTCRKAGLTTDAWLRGAKVWRFEADVFREIGSSPAAS